MFYNLKDLFPLPFPSHRETWCLKRLFIPFLDEKEKILLQYCTISGKKNLALWTIVWWQQDPHHLFWHWLNMCMGLQSQPIRIFILLLGSIEFSIPVATADSPRTVNFHRKNIFCLPAFTCTSYQILKKNISKMKDHVNKHKCCLSALASSCLSLQNRTSWHISTLLKCIIYIVSYFTDY